MLGAEVAIAGREIPGSNLLNVLVLDEDRAVRESSRDAVQMLGFRTLTAETAEQAYKLLESQVVDIVLLDLRLPGSGGLDALRVIKGVRPDALVIITTAYATVPSAVQAMRMRAFDYISKPYTMEELRLILERAMEELRVTTEKRLLRERLRSKHGFGSIVGRTPEMEKLYRIIGKAAQSTHPVLILGESGTGKELVARSIHYSGPFHDKPFIPVDCGSLVPTLIESELFGYVKGAFTGAVRAKEGLLCIADGGTIFLDEIGELPVDLQAKLLRAIQEKEVRPVGSTRRVPIKVRILAATNRDLEGAVAEGKFRRDLYYRLNVLTLRIPPLRERKADIPLLVEHFLERLARMTGNRRMLSEEAMKAMIAYDWPGNVRELENSLERSAAMSSGPTLHLGDLPSPVQGAIAQIQATRAVMTPKIVPLANLERDAILNAIQQLNGDKLQAARMLGIGKTTLYRKLKEYVLE
jgi:two-component system response regulator HydG